MDFQQRAGESGGGYIEIGPPRQGEHQFTIELEAPESDEHRDVMLRHVETELAHVVTGARRRALIVTVHRRAEGGSMTLKICERVSEEAEDRVGFLEQLREELKRGYEMSVTAALQ